MRTSPGLDPQGHFVPTPIVSPCLCFSHTHEQQLQMVENGENGCTLRQESLHFMLGGSACIDWGKRQTAPLVYSIVTHCTPGLPGTPICPTYHIEGHVASLFVKEEFGWPFWQSSNPTNHFCLNRLEGKGDLKLQVSHISTMLHYVCNPMCGIALWGTKRVAGGGPRPQVPGFRGGVRDAAPRCLNFFFQENIFLLNLLLF